ncbi:hypothetical protein TSUD_04490 [Trifolium subterraneum]|nr:hypothetical protein TSUD_04490 [Trifolium subterraneum]
MGLNSSPYYGKFITKLNIGKIVQEAVTLSPAVVISLSFYTFWTSKRNHNFSYLDIFLNGSIFVIILLILIKILYPSGNLL